MIAGGTDRARREEMPGSKVTSAPRAPVPARASTGRWAGLSTWRGVRSEPACRGGGRARDARSRSIRRSSHPPPVARASGPRLQKGCRCRRRQGAPRRGREALRCGAVRRRARREGACAACAARRARHGERGLRLGLRRQQSLGWPSMVHSIGQGARPVRPDRRDRPDRVEHVPNPPAAPAARIDPFGSRRAPAAQELPLASAAE